MKYFVSHSGNDSIWAEGLLEILSLMDPGIARHEDIFFSSKPETGSDAKDELLLNIDLNMRNAEHIIILATENYLRSIFCFYELSLASFYARNGKKVVLVVQKEDVRERIVSLFPGNTYIDAQNENAAEFFKKAIAGDKNVDEESIEKTKEFFSCMKVSSVPIGTPFIGMKKDQYNNTLYFAEKYGVELMTFGYPSTPDKIEEKLKNAESIYFVATTGSGFLKTYKKILAKAIKDGADFYVVMADRNSQFCKDVGEIEVLGNDNSDFLASNNCERINTEFDSTVQYLNEMYVEASGYKNTDVQMGKITCCSGYTLIRQTVLLVSYKDNSSWGWITSTMPPERCATCTPSLVFENKSEEEPDKNGDNSNEIQSNLLGNVVAKYCQSLVNLAFKHNCIFTIDGGTLHLGFENTNTRASDFEVINKANSYWRDKYNRAKAIMEHRNSIYDAVLIEVAAQHPLLKQRYPNTEFRERLNKAIEMYKRWVEQGIPTNIYIPGSRHMFNGVVDEISLSAAGYTYLRENGVPEEDLLGEDMNIKYKGDSGVYNSADECYVAAKIFQDGEFGKLISICSPNQLTRKTMLYIEFGVLPQCHSVTTDRLFHGDIVSEVFDSLNTVLYLDHSWQSEDSECFISSRKERKP